MSKCKNCGGVLYFEPNTQSMHCRKCGSNFALQKIYKYDKHSFDMEGKTIEKKFSIAGGSACPNCGAGADGEAWEITSICKYCGAIKIPDLDKELAPDVVLPFAFDVEEAKIKFKEGIKKKNFLPNKFKKQVFKDIDSVYIPAYLCDVKTHNSYSGEIYDEHKSADGDRHKHYTKINGVQDVEEKNLIVECSSQLTQATLSKILPFDISSAVKFSPNYLMGYSVEYYDKNLEDCKQSLKALATANIRKKILDNYSYDGVSYLHIDSTYYDCVYSKIILPTYKVKFKYKNKDYATFMNGQSGKVGGNLPKSAIKIFFFTMGIFVGIGVITLLMALLFMR